jgi:Ni/Fe-hydrogenase subunit HybB-like protein
MTEQLATGEPLAGRDLLSDQRVGRLHGVPVARNEVRAAAFRPMLDQDRWWWRTVGVLGAIVVLGIVAWAVQLADGLGVSGYNDQAFWATYEANMVAFIGISYGGAVISAVLRITKASWRTPLTRIAEATALVTLPIGMVFIVPHLGRSERIWELVWPPYWNLSSPILWDFIAISTYLLATAVFFSLPLLPDLKIGADELADRQGLRARLCRRCFGLVSRRWNNTPRQRRTLDGAIGLVAIMVIPTAVSVHSVLSFAFSSSSRAGYMETILPVYFVVAALYTGVALVIIAVTLLRRAYRLERFITDAHLVRLGFILVAFDAVYLYLTFTEYLVDGYSGKVGDAAWVRQILIGRYWVPFWFYVVAAGLLPLLVMALPRLRNTKGVAIASALVLFAMWVKRLVIIVPAASEPLVNSPIAANGGLQQAAWGTYHFTWVPISITVAGTAAIPLLLLLLFKVVPILPVAELEEEVEGHEVEGQARDHPRSSVDSVDGEGAASRMTGPYTEVLT